MSRRYKDWFLVPWTWAPGFATSLADAHDYDDLFVVFLGYSMQRKAPPLSSFLKMRYTSAKVSTASLRRFGEGLYLHAFFNLGTKGFIPCQNTKVDGKINDVMWGVCLRIRFPAIWLVQWSYRSHTKVTSESNSKPGVGIDVVLSW
jgi:hypothetical protein